MAFLNPVALWGLLAIAVPIIVHFFNLQRPRQIHFSNVAFVKEIKRTVIKRINFQRWALLLLRIAGIAAAVLMFANPVKTTQDSQLLQGSRSIAIVIDNSLSMISDNERGEYFRQAISLSRNIIKAYQEEDEFLVTSTSNLSLQSGFSGQEETLDQLEEMSIKQNLRSLGDVLSVTHGLFGQASGSVRELYVISDFQQSTILADSSLRTGQDSAVNIMLIPVATRQPDNIYISDHEFESQILTADDPAILSLTLVNSGDNAVSDISVRVILEQNVVSISNQSLNAGEIKPVQVSFIPGKTGWINGYIELDDNPIDFDNRRYFSCYVPEKEKVLVIESSARQESRIRLLFEEVFTQIDPVFVSEKSLGALTFADYRSIVWDGMQEVSTGLSAKIQAYLETGGSIMVFPDLGSQLDGINAFFSQAGAGVIRDVVSIEEGIDMRTYELDHPVFDGMFTGDRAAATAEEIRVFKYFPFQVSGNIQQSVIMEMENGLPFLTENLIGEGRLFWFSVNASDAWSDFQVKTIFPPLLYRITQIMNQSGSLSLDQEIGDFAPVQVKASAQLRIDLRDEYGDTFIPERIERGNISRLSFENMDLAPGNYDIIQEDSILTGISFNISDEESDLKFNTKDLLESWISDEESDANIQVLSPDIASLVRRVSETREGSPLWIWFLWLVLGCLLLEVVILGGFPMKKSANHPHTAN